METSIGRAVALLAAVAFATAAVGTAPAFAQTKSKSVQTEAEWIAFNPDESTVEVKVKKPGRGKVPKELRLKRGKNATFKVKPEGSILTRTSVAINGKKGELKDIPVGKTVNVYWVPDTADPTMRFARKIDVILSDEELDAMYGTE